MVSRHEPAGSVRQFSPDSRYTSGVFGNGERGVIHLPFLGWAVEVQHDDESADREYATIVAVFLHEDDGTALTRTEVEAETSLTLIRLVATEPGARK